MKFQNKYVCRVASNQCSPPSCCGSPVPWESKVDFPRQQTYNMTSYWRHVIIHPISSLKKTTLVGTLSQPRHPKTFLPQSESSSPSSKNNKNLGNYQQPKISKNPPSPHPNLAKDAFSHICTTQLHCKVSRAPSCQRIRSRATVTHPNAPIAIDATRHWPRRLIDFWMK